MAIETSDIWEVFRTQRAIRMLKPDPIPDAVLRRILRAATRAPSASNSQPWAFLVVKDRAVKERIWEWYTKAQRDTYGEAAARMTRTSFAETPVIVVPCHRSGGARMGYTSAASIYPAVQNLMLAARALGVGSVLTTMHRRYQAEIREILGVPADVETAALIPMGYPADDRFGANRRRPIDEVTYLDRWEQPYPWPPEGTA